MSLGAPVALCARAQFALRSRAQQQAAAVAMATYTPTYESIARLAICLRRNETLEAQALETCVTSRSNTSPQRVYVNEQAHAPKTTLHISLCGGGGGGTNSAG